MTNRTTSNKMLSIVAVVAMLVATTTIAALVTQPVGAQNISIPTNNTQLELVTPLVIHLQ